MTKKLTDNEYQNLVSCRGYKKELNEYSPLEPYINTKTPVLIRHNKCGYEWKITPNHFLNGNRRCPKCQSKIKFSKDDITEKINEIYNGEYELVSDYNGILKPIEVKHLICGKVFSIKAYWFIKESEKFVCKFCRENNKTKVRWDKERIENRLHELYGEEYSIAGEYSPSNRKISLIHNKCGYKWECNINILHKRCSCPNCSGKLKKTKDSFQEELNKLFGCNTILLIGEYVNIHKETKFHCSKCNSDFYSTPSLVKNSKYGCSLCTPRSKKIFSMVKDEIEAIDNNSYELLSDDYENCATKLTVRHKKCENVFYPSYSSFVTKGTRCPYCNKYKSKGEDELYEFLTKELHLPFIQRDRDILNGFELDLLCRDIGVAIEYDGLYWHSFDKMKESKHLSDKDIKNYHLNKTLKCADHGIRLIHLFDDEWILKKDIVKDYLMVRLGSTESFMKIGARKCDIRIPTKREKVEFLNNNHIQGNDNSQIFFGLYYNDLLLSIITFTKIRKIFGISQVNTESDYELCRFSVKLGYIVCGAFSKLLSHFKRNFSFRTIITYADRRFSNGDLYTKNGFNLLRCSNPSYYYFNKSCNFGDGTKARYHRFKFAPFKFRNDPSLRDMREEDLYKYFGYMRIYDCGQLVFTYTNE